MTPGGGRRSEVVDQVVCAEAAMVAACSPFDFHAADPVTRSNTRTWGAVVERFHEALALVRSGSVAWLLAGAAVAGPLVAAPGHSSNMSEKVEKP
jgi:hypothetical protein